RRVGPGSGRVVRDRPDLRGGRGRYRGGGAERPVHGDHYRRAGWPRPARHPARPVTRDPGSARPLTGPPGYVEFDDIPWDMDRSPTSRRCHPERSAGGDQPPPGAAKDLPGAWLVRREILRCAHADRGGLGLAAGSSQDDRIAVADWSRARRADGSEIVSPDTHVNPAALFGLVHELDRDRLDIAGGFETEDARIEVVHGVQGAADVLGLAEAVLLALKGDIGVRDPVGLQCLHHRLGLRRWDDRIFQSLEQDDRAGDAVGVVERRPLTVQVLGLGVGADQAVEVARLELVRVASQSGGVGYAE